MGTTTSHDGGGDLRERPVREVAEQLARDLPLLVRQEARLARAEMREKGRLLLPGLGMIGAAGLLALCAAGAFTAFLVLALAVWLDAWLAALLAGAVLGAAAGLLALTGKERVEEAGAPVPEETMAKIEEDARWLKEHARSARR